MSEDKGIQVTSEPIMLALLQECIELSENCDISPTGFSVGSVLYLPNTSPHYPKLKDYFRKYIRPSDDDDKLKGLYLAGSWSRHLPGNTHAEANALTLFREHYNEGVHRDDLPKVEDVLKDTWCIASMEPCSIRTSGNPSCSKALVDAHVARVYLGIQEPPDYVQCEGVRILQEGGVEVWRIQGLEDECLQAARRGL